jgi:hypothetical protein
LPKSAKYSRIPTAEELNAFDGMHCARLYRAAVEKGWHCQSCKRTARELVRWTEIRGPSWRARYGDEHGMGFTVTLTVHHCHGSGRFPDELICGDCNSADGVVKRKLGLPRNWSFSPSEIGSFIQVMAHSGATMIDYNKAGRLFAKLAEDKYGSG